MSLAVTLAEPMEEEPTAVTSTRVHSLALDPGAKAAARSASSSAGWWKKDASG
jgi:hypothetical protein